MSIPADFIRVLHEARYTVDDIVAVAEAMECGPDAKTLFGLYDAMVLHGRPATETAKVLVMVSGSINERRISRFSRPSDEHSCARDSNRSRRKMSDHEWRILRQTVFSRDEHYCQYCGSDDDLTCDHIVPLVRGGTNELKNLTTACRPCNSSKGDRLLDEWRGRRT